MSAGDFSSLAGVGLTMNAPVTVFVQEKLRGVGYLPPDFVPSRAPVLTDRLQQGAAKGFAHLLQEAMARGGRGLVEVSVEHRLVKDPNTKPLSRSDQSTFVLDNLVMQIGVTGTVVRGAGEPFLTALAGVELALLMRAGYEPTSIAWGVGVATDAFLARGAERARRWGGRFCQDGELPRPTEAVTMARTEAMENVHSALTACDLVMLRPTTLMRFDTVPEQGTIVPFSIVTCLASGAAGSFTGADDEVDVTVALAGVPGP